MVKAKRKRLGEFALIERYFRPLATAPGAFGLIDDAASYTPSPGEEMVFTVDTIAAGVHFFPEDPPASISRKALRVNLSDLAAKGAKPVGYLLSLALPGDWTEDWVKGFAEGLAQDQAEFGFPLLGGDTTRASGGCTISVTAIGTVPKGGMVLRSGARPGDVIFVSGTIGDAALGLAVRLGTIATTGEVSRHLTDRYLHPRPRLALAPAIGRFANSAMDVSDGLVGDLAHICDASGIGAVIEAANVPLSDEARVVISRNDAAMAIALTRGDDYEILATVSPDKASDFAEAAASAGVPVTPVGHMLGKKGKPVVLDRNGEPIELSGLGHEHF